MSYFITLYFAGIGMPNKADGRHAAINCRISAEPLWRYITLCSCHIVSLQDIYNENVCIHVSINYMGLERRTCQDVKI